MTSLIQQKKKLIANSFKRSKCPIACTLDIIGDKWTLLIIRDLFLGRTRYMDFIESGEGITTNILADRLNKLEHAGLITRKPYQTRPVRYEYGLSESGKNLESVIFSMINWGNRYIPGTNIRKRKKS